MFSSILHKIISKLDERFIRDASGTKRKLRSFDLIRDSEDDGDDDSDENEEEFGEKAFKYVQRGSGRFGGTKKRPHLETSKNFQRGGSLHQAEMKKSKKAEKRGRFHHWQNNQNHQRKDFLADQVVHFTHHNKFH